MAMVVPPPSPRRAAEADLVEAVRVPDLRRRDTARAAAGERLQSRAGADEHMSRSKDRKDIAPLEHL